MPIYEYRCASCGYQKEYLLRMSDAPLTVCPECSKGTFSKMVTAAGFQLKGSGWYVTDFKNGSKPKAEQAKPVASAKKEETKEAKAETPSSTSAAASGN
jgi:putative FmdB family regulatory protein